VLRIGGIIRARAKGFPFGANSTRPDFESDGPERPGDRHCDDDLVALLEKVGDIGGERAGSFEDAYEGAIHANFARAGDALADEP
jgi:hypothetical protein